MCILISRWYIGECVFEDVELFANQKWSAFCEEGFVIEFSFFQILRGLMRACECVCGESLYRCFLVTSSAYCAAWLVGLSSGDGVENLLLGLVDVSEDFSLESV